MMVLSVQDIEKSFGIDKILKGISFSIQNNERMGLTGLNGCGKTTLLRIINNEINADSGLVHISKDIRIGYLAQNNDINDNTSLWDSMLDIFKEAIDLETKIAKLELSMENFKSDGEAIQLANNYHRLCERFNAIEGYAYKGEITGVLNGLGFMHEVYDRSLGSFSGGEKTRLALARILLQKPELILMDEPTNHLDLNSIAWLERYLTAYKGAIIVISHDRYFLDHVCTSIGEISNGKIIKYSGNYGQYQKKRTINQEAEQKAYDMQQKLIEREKSIIARYRSFNREKSIKAAESRQKRLDKIDVLERPIDDKQINFKFESRIRTGEDVLKVKNVSKSFDNNILFENISFKLRAGDRVALIGDNGTGKSTLFNIIIHELEPDTGYSSFGANVDPGYYHQQHRHLHMGKTVLDEVWDRFPNLEQYQVRGALGLFLFTGDEVFKPIIKLSGGEKARVALSTLMLQKNNFLLLDEPTNHLDMDSREVLEQALSEYDGTILAISHDRYFINKFANKIFVMEENKITEYLGNYDDYIEKKNMPQEPVDDENRLTKTAVEKLKKRDKLEQLRVKEYEKRLKDIESAILLSEERCKELELLLSNPDTYKDNLFASEYHIEYAQEQENQMSLYDEMEALEDSIA